MLPDIWGRCAWKFLHLVTIGYPDHPTEMDKIHFYQFFENLQYVLPCEKCRKNLAQHLQKYPLTNEVLSSRKNLIKWGIDLHNVVNYYLGKPMLSYNEALNELSKLVNPPKNNNYLFYIILIIVIIIVIYLLFHYYFRKSKYLKN